MKHSFYVLAKNDAKTCTIVKAKNLQGLKDKGFIVKDVVGKFPNLEQAVKSVLGYFDTIKYWL